MTKKELNHFFLSFTGAKLTFPFGEEAKVYKVEGKMFGLITEVDGFIMVNLKGDPDDNIALRGMFDYIKPGYHMNKTHWNSLYLDGTEERDLVFRLIEESYNLIVSKLPKKVREGLSNQII